MSLSLSLQKKKKLITNYILSKVFQKTINPWASLVAQKVKNLPAMWNTWVRSLGCQGPMEEGMATHSSILAWRILMD